MRRIFKYALAISKCQALLLPRGAKIVLVQMQWGYLQLWAEVDPDAPLESREIAVFGTGHDIPEDWNLRYLAGVVTPDDLFVWHVYELLNEAK